MRPRSTFSWVWASHFVLNNRFLLRYSFSLPCSLRLLHVFKVTSTLLFALRGGPLFDQHLVIFSWNSLHRLRHIDSLFYSFVVSLLAFTLEARCLLITCDCALAPHQTDFAVGIRYICWLTVWLQMLHWAVTAYSTNDFTACYCLGGQKHLWRNANVTPQLRCS